MGCAGRERRGVRIVPRGGRGVLFCLHSTIEPCVRPFLWWMLGIRSRRDPACPQQLHHRWGGFVFVSLGAQYVAGTGDSIHRRGLQSKAEFQVSFRDTRKFTVVPPPASAPLTFETRHRPISLSGVRVWWWLFPYPRNVGKDRSLWLWGLRVRWSAVCPCHAACPVRQQQQFRFLAHASCRTEHAVPHAHTQRRKIIAPHAAPAHRSAWEAPKTPQGILVSLIIQAKSSTELIRTRLYLQQTCSSDRALRTLTPQPMYPAGCGVFFPTSTIAHTHPRC